MKSTYNENILTKMLKNKAKVLNYRLVKEINETDFVLKVEHKESKEIKLIYIHSGNLVASLNY